MPLKTFDWKGFLEQWSEDFLESTLPSHHLPPEVLESRWLGYSAATEEQIAETEERIHVTLPPSYREFLKVSNGWRQTTPFIYRIWSVQEIEWFTLRHQIWIESFIEKHISLHHPRGQNERLNGSLATPHILDSEYLIYGDEQDCSKIRFEYLHSALEISEKGESAIYLLNPKVKTENGEWEAWFFGDWLPGADRYPSFQALMEAEYRNFLELREAL